MAVSRKPATVPDFSPGLFKRPTTSRGLVSWLTTIDHKRIGILYFVSGLFFFLIGGLEALMLRTQLTRSGLHLMSPELYNQLFTMHGTTMIFLAVMPMSAGFFNWLTPLMIGARDVAFPRLNSFSYWTFFFGALVLNLSWFLGGAPNAGWFGYSPLTSKAFNPGLGIDFWVFGLQMLGLASLLAGFNFIVTIINMRAPGMTMMKLPIFVWMTLVVQFIVIFAFPVITIALVELMMDRKFGTGFFNPNMGGMPIYWQHLFCVFGHPEVYILILPAMGIVSEVLPTFSRKPLFGYPVVVASGALIAFMGFAVWSHHMFTTGMGAVANAAFAVTTMIIGIPTGVKIFNWIGTLWGGKLRLTTPMLFALGFIFMFTLGGISGIMHSMAPADAQQQDSYFIVAHFHYVLIGGSIFGLFAGFYYWFPMVTGRMLNEHFGKWVFWLMFAGFNITFFPMHFLGLNGMARRTHSYDAALGFDGLNTLATIGSYILAFGVLVLVVHVMYDIFNGKKASFDPWDARTLEWSLPLPVPVYNFAELPEIKYRDQFWFDKHPELAHSHGHSTGTADQADHLAGHGDASSHHVGHAEHHDDHGVHLPGQSWYPFVMPLGLFILVFGGLYNSLTLAIIGFCIVAVGAYAWAFEGIGGKHIKPEGQTWYQ
ncbi:MAG: cytochrome c oxidase subunit I [Deinococcales bacterium]